MLRWASVTNFDIARFYFKHVKSVGWVERRGVRGMAFNRRCGGRYGRRAAQHRFPTLPYSTLHTTWLALARCNTMSSVPLLQRLPCCHLKGSNFRL